MTNEDDFNPTARIAQITNKCYSKFWVVTNPTKDSTLADICFESDAHALELQFKGGLNSADVCGFYISESAAKETARNLISWAHPNESTGTYDHLLKSDSAAADLDAAFAAQLRRDRLMNDFNTAALSDDKFDALNAQETEARQAIDDDFAMFR